MNKADAAPEPHRLPDIDLDNDSWSQLLPASLIAEIDKVPVELYLLGEHKLKLRLKQKLRDYPYLDRLRMAFWFEYDCAQNLRHRMRVSAIYSAAGISKQHWCNEIITDVEALAWILTPPGNYMVALQDVLLSGVRRMKDIVEAEIIRDDGTLDAKAASVVLSVVESAHIKVHGAPVMRLEKKSLNVNVNGPPMSSGSKTVAELEAELASLKAKALPPAPPPDVMSELTSLKDVVPIDVVKVGGSDD